MGHAPFANSPTAEATQGCQYLAAGTRRTALSLQVVQVTVNGRCGNSFGGEGIPPWFCGKPLPKPAQGRQVGANSFGIFGGQRLGKIL